MRTYEFTTNVTPDGKLLLPGHLAQNISQGESVHVTLVIGQKKKSGEESLLALEQLVSEIKRTPQNPQGVQLASGLLFEHLAHPLGEPDPVYDVETWNRQWDEIEQQMDEEELLTENKKEPPIK